MRTTARILAMQLLVAIMLCSCAKSEKVYWYGEGCYHHHSVMRTVPDDGSPCRYGVDTKNHYDEVKRLIPVVYDAVTWFEVGDIMATNTYYACEIDGKYDIYTSMGDSLIQGLDYYQVYNPVSNGLYFPVHAIMEKGNDKYVVFRLDAKKVFGPYDDIYVCDSKVAFFKKDGKWGAFKYKEHSLPSALEKRTDGLQFLPPEFDKIVTIGRILDNQYSYYLAQKDGEWIYYDDSGEVTTDRYSDINPDHAAYAMDGNGSVGSYHYIHPYGYNRNRRDEATWNYMTIRLGKPEQY